MSDIIRQARAAYGPGLDRMMEEAGRIKEEYVAQGGDPSEVYSPERMSVLQEGGPEALASADPAMREDGSIAGPYVPTEMAIESGMIQPEAMPAVLSGLMGGVNTVSSGVGSDGRGYAIGRNQDGSIVRIGA